MSVPPSSSPRTSVPPSSWPRTSVPPSSLPRTSVPPCSGPRTSVPPSSLPRMSEFSGLSAMLAPSNQRLLSARRLAYHQSRRDLLSFSGALLWPGSPLPPVAVLAALGVLEVRDVQVGGAAQEPLGVLQVLGRREQVRVRPH